jgi:hypothetical protein
MTSRSFYNLDSSYNRSSSARNNLYGRGSRTEISMRDELEFLIEGEFPEISYVQQLMLLVKRIKIIVAHTV